MEDLLLKNPIPMEAFDDCVKRSTHFADIINTHRTAMGEVVAGVLRPMVADGAVSLETVLQSLKDLERSTSRPSIDGERRHAVSAIRAAIQGW